MGMFAGGVYNPFFENPFKGRKAGKHGNGEERKASLGSRYDEVQAEVNRRLQANDIDDLARRTYRGEFGNGDQRRQKLGSLYDAVQKRVNELYG